MVLLGLPLHESAGFHKDHWEHKKVLCRMTSGSGLTMKAASLTKAKSTLKKWAMDQSKL